MDFDDNSGIDRSSRKSERLSEPRRGNSIVDCERVPEIFRHREVEIIGRGYPGVEAPTTTKMVAENPFEMLRTEEGSLLNLLGIHCDHRNFSHYDR